MDDLSRRDLIKLGAAVTVAASVGVGEALAQSGAANSPSSFFTPHELALVDELSEMIIPTDEHSPGARAAKVAAYIDGFIAEAWDDNVKTAWREGLSLVDKLSQDASGKPFLQASPEQRLAIVTRMAQNEDRPGTPEQRFFGDLKARVVHAYYTSEIGIKQEMEYKGNSYLNEFVGTDVRS
jgi:Gluconate 2-dehydrogenase subunit 3